MKRKGLVRNEFEISTRIVCDRYALVFGVKGSTQVSALMPWALGYARLELSQVVSKSSSQLKAPSLRCRTKLVRLCQLTSLQCCERAKGSSAEGGWMNEWLQSYAGKSNWDGMMDEAWMCGVHFYECKDNAGYVPLKRR